MNFRKLIDFYHQHPLFLILIFASFLAIFRVWEDRVFFTDELLIEDASYTMAKEGEWLIPRVNGYPDLTKPPFVYWVTAPLYFIFSVNPWVRRIPTVFLGILLSGVTYKLAEYFFNKRVALLSSLFLITSGLFVFFTKAANFDLANAFFTTTAIYFYNLGKKWEKYLILVSLAFSLGIMTRSFLALIPFLVIIGDYFLFIKERAIGKKLLKYFLFSIALITPWHIMAYLKEPINFIERYIRMPIFSHALGRVEGEVVTTPFFYLVIFILFPASVLSLGYLVLNLKRKIKSKDTQMILWILIYFLILIFSKSRHEWYLIYLAPPLAILAGAFFYQIERKNKVIEILLKVFFLILILAFPLSLFIKPLPQHEPYEAVKIMERESGFSEKLYLWEDYRLVPITKFFPGRRIERLSETNIREKLEKDKKLFVILEKDRESEIPDIGDKQNLYESKNVFLIKVSQID